MSRSDYPSRSGWLFVPSLYFQQGLPCVLVQTTSVLLYKKLGLPNDRIGLWTSLTAWPWILKGLWSPYIDATGKKRTWALLMQAGVTAGLVAAAAAVTADAFLPATLAVFFAMAVLSATYDAALDGYYMLALSPERQAFFSGIRMSFWRLAWLFSSGALVVLAGYWEKKGVGIKESWRDALLAGAAVYGFLSVYALAAMPHAPLDGPARSAEAGAGFLEALREFLSKERIVAILLFVAFYQFGEAMVTKMSGPFLLDRRAVGGLGLETMQVGMILGNVGAACLVAGATLGGVVIAKFGLKRCVWPMALSMNLPNLMYLWAAKAQPGAPALYAITVVEQLGYGFGLISYMVFLLYISQGTRYATSHYAIATGVKALGSMAAGVVSGYLQQSLGYFYFFAAVCLAGVPGMLLLTLIPLEFPAQGDAA